MLPDLSPMLADRGLPRCDLAGWSAEPKLDGWRVIVTADEALLDRPYLERRQRLEDLDLAGPCRVLPRFAGSDAADLLAACTDHDVEGVVLKRHRSIYRPGERTRHWRKVKTAEWAALHRPRRGPQDPQ